MVSTLLKIGIMLILANFIWLVWEIFLDKKELIALKVAVVHSLIWLMLLIFYVITKL